MTKFDDLVAVRVRIPRTWPRVLLGVALLPVGILWSLDLSVFPGLASLWAASVLIGKAEYIVSIEGGLLVLRTASRFAPNLTRRIGMDRVRGRRFAVLRYRRDESNVGYRPLLKPRLVLLGDGGVSIWQFGAALNLAEAEETQVSLNRLLESEGPGLERPPRGVNDDDFVTF